MRRIFMLLIALLSNSGCEAETEAPGLTDLMHTCDDDSCIFIDEDYHLFSSPDYKNRLFTLMSSGVPYIFWRSLGSLKHPLPSSISEECITDLKSWNNKMMSGQRDALMMIDSSGKHPATSMTKTSATLGDYDECLTIESAQFCSLEVFPKRMNNSMQSKKFYSLDQQIKSQNDGFIVTLCVPGRYCTKHEVKQLIDMAVAPYLMTTGPGFVTCDSRNSISWASVLFSFTKYQMISLCFIVCMTIFALGATSLHLYFLLQGREIPREGKVTTIASFSAIESSKSIFYTRSSYFDDPRHIFLDLFKASGVCFTAIAHSVSASAAPLGYSLYDNLGKHAWLLEQPFAQSFMNEAGVSVFFAISGFSAFHVVYPMAKANKLPYLLAFIDRFLKLLPAMATIVAVELIYPILGSGPLYSQFINYTVKKCSANGWKNLLMINNWISPSCAICAPQTFYASLLMQFLVITLIVTKIMMKSEKWGLICCWILIFGSNTWTGLNAWIYEISPTYMNPFPNHKEVLDFLEFIHFHFATNCGPFFMGFLAGFYIMERKITLNLTTITQVVKWLVLNAILQNVSDGVLVAHNCYKLIDKIYAPAVILVNRISKAASTVLLLFMLYSVNDFGFLGKVKQRLATEKDEKVFSWIFALVKLSLGVFFVNITFVHYELFTRRRLMNLDLYTILAHSQMILISVFILSFLLHVIFVHPINLMIKKIITRKAKVQ